MRASHELSRVEVSFDDPNLVSHAGLLQAASLWQRLGMPGVIARGLRLPGSVGANSDAKVATVVMGMLAVAVQSSTRPGGRTAARRPGRGRPAPAIWKPS
jgi:hypothetical protein